MLDQIRREIQARLEELLGEIDKLRRALTALTSRESEPDRRRRAAPVAGSAAGQSAKSPAPQRVGPHTHSLSSAAPLGAARQPSRRPCPHTYRAGCDQGCGPGRAKRRQRDDRRRDPRRHRTRPRDGQHNPLEARDVGRDHQGRPRLPDQT